MSAHTLKRTHIPRVTTIPTSDARAGSWVLPANPGVYATVPVWNGGTAWLNAVMDDLNTPDGEAERRRVKVSPATLLRVAHYDQLAADPATGRNLATAHETVAAALDLSSRTVKRSRAWLINRGFQTIITHGRYLTSVERTHARNTHGGYQTRAASLRALTLPTPVENTAPVENVPLPRSGSVKKEASVVKNSPTRTYAREKAATRPQPRLQSKKNHPKSTPRSPNGHQVEKPRPVVMHQFAYALIKRMPWLLPVTDSTTGQRKHIGNVMRTLENAGINPARWTPAGGMITDPESPDYLNIVDFITQLNTAITGTSLSPTKIKQPLAYLTWLIKKSITPQETTPMEQRRTRRQKLHAERTAWRAQQETQRKQAADTFDPDEWARTRTESDTQIRTQNTKRNTTEHNSQAHRVVNRRIPYIPPPTRGLTR
jgi:hypothetical protein